MLSVAVCLDAIGFVLFCLSWLGVDDYGILDIVGGVIIGGWILMRYSSLGSKGLEAVIEESEPQEAPDAGEQKVKEGVEKAGKKIEGNLSKSGEKQAEKQISKQVKKQVAKRVLIRFGIALVVEIIPFLGGLAPAWTIMVWKELKS